MYVTFSRSPPSKVVGMLVLFWSWHQGVASPRQSRWTYLWPRRSRQVSATESFGEDLLFTTCHGRGSWFVWRSAARGVHGFQVLRRIRKPRGSATPGWELALQICDPRRAMVMGVSAKLSPRHELPRFWRAVYGAVLRPCFQPEHRNVLNLLKMSARKDCSVSKTAVLAGLF